MEKTTYERHEISDAEWNEYEWIDARTYDDFVNKRTRLLRGIKRPTDNETINISREEFHAILDEIYNNGIFSMYEHCDLVETGESPDFVTRSMRGRRKFTIEFI